MVSQWIHKYSGTLSEQYRMASHDLEMMEYEMYDLKKEYEKLAEFVEGLEDALKEQD